MTYDAIVFDMDGVLLEKRHTDPDVYRKATRGALADFAVKLDEPPDQLVTPDSTATVRQFCNQHGVQAETFWSYREHAATSLENSRIEERRRGPFGDVDVLELLSEQSALGIASNNRHGTVRFVCDTFDWLRYVDAFRGRIPTLNGYERKKPEPDYLMATIADLPIDPDSTLFVGDRLSDIEAATRAGTDVALLDRNDDHQTCEPEPTFVIESLRELLRISSTRD